MVAAILEGVWEAGGREKSLPVVGFYCGRQQLLPVGKQQTGKNLIEKLFIAAGFLIVFSKIN